MHLIHLCSPFLLPLETKFSGGPPLFQISVRRVIFSGMETEQSKPNLENTVDSTSVRSLIRLILP